MQFLKFNRGVGLIQVLLAGALLAGIGLASLQLFNTQRKSVVHSAQQYEEEQIIETIKGLLANEDTCTQTFLLAPTSGSKKDLRSFSGTTQIVAVNSGGNKIAFVRNQPIGKQGLQITRYELNDSAVNLKKYFGMPGTPPASPVNTATYRIKYTVLFVTIKRREAADNISGFGSASMKYGIPLVAVTETTVPANRWLIQLCRAASGSNSVWTRTSADMMNIYYADGNVGIGTVPITSGATAALVQVAGSVYVDGNLTVTNSASVAKVNVKGQLVIPLVAPTTPQNGMIWMP
ncbi:MAG: hypothetical protein A2381_15430 [Bdellovibrionales bacterium RIFOXYB1_FULL_37_110]|nr:MAG: hypothetical protein A2417_07280 [Bdellovibrionales bacterium RIFOXYC1_FULL_37_79]OFZ57014.1 MAG: hypothetical protein A2381_15430 [Bdellovibrionales bacterium RIFOXYB1_FULL_37_110]OFZ64013.1 MAG: hypothetical protein A2577_16045 [Bdellovibrionales bacterium RIFOXYD1_FULL_36_51]